MLAIAFSDRPASHAPLARRIQSHHPLKMEVRIGRSRKLKVFHQLLLPALTGLSIMG